MIDRLFNQNKLYYENNSKITSVWRVKKETSRIFIYIQSCAEKHTEQVKVRIIDTKGRNCCNSGDYYLLDINTPYSMYNCVDDNDRYQIQFSSSVSFIWFPYFEQEFLELTTLLQNKQDILYYINQFKTTQIKIRRRGIFYPQNEYHYDSSFKLLKERQICYVTSSVGVLFTKQRVFNDIIQPYEVECLPQRVIELHEEVQVLEVVKDEGRIVYKNMEGWINIRYVTQFGNGGMCDCQLCSNGKFKREPIYHFYNDKTLLRNIALEQLLYNQYMNKIDNTLQQYQQQQQLITNLSDKLLIKLKQYSFDPELEILYRLHENYSRNINWEQITQQMNQIHKQYVDTKQAQRYTTKQIQRLYSQQIIPKTKRNVPQEMLNELKNIAVQCFVPPSSTNEDYTQLKHIHNILKQEMNQHMIDYQNPNDNIKNWISRNKLKQQKISNEEIKKQVQNIVLKYKVINSDKQQQNFFDTLKQFTCSKELQIDVCNKLQQILSEDMGLDINDQQLSQQKIQENDTLQTEFQPFETSFD
ncbi:Hypothetical_protein [Hexamita inflata]|uniref:Hypothetical_protein n=1 Tax=Hexamita inflata TaxID=28002 RepID=A0AA86RFD1_9EUKA|nr:Hypothetical protein HINF_LOCUS59587 [Hexamita inflata]